MGRGQGKGVGAGVPISFSCSKCRRHRNRHQNVELTGRKRERLPEGNWPAQSTLFQRQYRCLVCGFVGWSNHYDLERMESAVAQQEKGNE